MHMYIYICIHIYMHACMHACIHAYMHTYIHLFDYITLHSIALHYLTLPYITLHYIASHHIHICICVYICVYACTHACMCIEPCVQPLTGPSIRNIDYSSYSNIMPLQGEDQNCQLMVYKRVCNKGGFTTEEPRCSRYLVIMELQVPKATILS